MARIERTSFTNRLRGFLAPKWVSQGLTATRIDAVDKSLSTDPVAPIDAIYSELASENDTGDHYAGFKSLTRQLLSDDILNTLIQMQSDMLTMDDAPFTTSTLGERATEAYRHAQAAFPAAPEPVYYIGS